MITELASVWTGIRYEKGHGTGRVRLVVPDVKHGLIIIEKTQTEKQP